jgi:transcriptional regulator with XRE-family HTH domain
MLTEADVRRRLALVWKRTGSQRAVATELRVNQATINEVLNGKREPPPKLLAALGLERVVTYRERQGA